MKRSFSLVILALFIGVLCSGADDVSKARDAAVAPAIKKEGVMTVQALKKVVMIVAAKNFRDEELQKPQAIMTRAGVKVTLASSVVGAVQGVLGSTARAEILVKDVKVADYDAVLFVGGPGADEYWNSPVAHAIARKAVESGKVLGAICIAPVTLANAGVLDGKKATVWSSDGEKLKIKGAMYTARNLEVDGKIITADGPNSAEAFGNAVLKAIQTP